MGVWLALGGGGAKGVAHLGVMRALQAEGVAIDGIVGTSAGSLMGAMYCELGDADAACSRVLDFIASDEFRNIRLAFAPQRGQRSLIGRAVDGLRKQIALERMFLYSSAFGGRALRFIVRSLVPKIDISALPIPLGITVLDLDQGEEVLLRDGDLVSAVVASSSVPGFFPPVERDDRLLCDAGIVDNMPVAWARRLGARHVLAVDLSATMAVRAEKLVGIQVLLRAEEISARLANLRRSQVADVTLTPDHGGRSWFDFDDLEPLVAEGERATRERMDDIRALAAASA